MLSRAQTALRYLRNAADSYGGELRWYIEPRESVWVDGEPYEWTDRRGEVHQGMHRKFSHMTEGVWIKHPDGEAMIAALEEVVRLLSPFRRTGRPKR